jgi:hypothetical protein
VKLTTYFQPVPRSRIHGSIYPPPIHLHDIVLNYLITAATLPLFGPCREAQTSRTRSTNETIYFLMSWIRKLQGVTCWRFVSNGFGKTYCFIFMVEEQDQQTYRPTTAPIFQISVPYMFSSTSKMGALFSFEMSLIVYQTIRVTSQKNSTPENRINLFSVERCLPGFDFRKGQKFFFLHSSYCGSLSLLSNGYRGQSDRGVKRVTHLDLVSS